MRIKFKRKWAVVAVLGFVGGLMAVSPITRSATWSVRGRSGPVSMHSVTATKTERPLAKPVPAQSPSSIDVDSITLGQVGFVPSAISRSPGQVVISVANRAGLQNMHLVFTQQSGSGGTVIFDQQVPNTTNDFAMLENLQPGVYVLTEASNSQWSCTFNVASQ